MDIRIKNITPPKYILIVFSLFSLFSILQYFLMQENTSWLYGYIILFLPIIIIIIGHRKMVLRLFHYFCYFILNDKEKYRYTNEITRERWFFSITFLFVSIIFTLLLPNTTFLLFDSSWAYLFRNSVLLSLILGFSYIGYYYHKEDLNNDKPKVKDNLSLIANDIILKKPIILLEDQYELFNDNLFECNSINTIHKMSKFKDLSSPDYFHWLYTEGKRSDKNTPNLRMFIVFILILSDEVNTPQLRNTEIVDYFNKNLSIKITSDHISKARDKIREKNLSLDFFIQKIKGNL
ncbi:MAG: hypothetical protein E6772_09770 [Dysgonomonas sp.]|nr:hypothetical protein [Dysgonomonas sp.]